MYGMNAKFTTTAILFVLTFVSACITGAHTAGMRQGIYTNVSIVDTTAVSWSDDFDDGNYDGWTVNRGTLSASDGVMRGVTAAWNWAHHVSSLATGTWSFDAYFMGSDDSSIWFVVNGLYGPDYNRPRYGYYVALRSLGTLELWRNVNDVQVALDTYTIPGGPTGWWHIDVTRATSGEINVYLNTTLRLTATDTSHSTSSYFYLQFYNTQAVDNIVVQDEVLEPAAEWSDDFSDGNYDGWTVDRGALSASTGIMRGTTATWNWVHHASTLANGTWSFDVDYVGDSFNVWFIATGLRDADGYDYPASGYFLSFSTYTDEVRLYKDSGPGVQSVLDSYHPASLDGWWNVTITRDSSGQFTVYIGGVSTMEVSDTGFTTSAYFYFEAYSTHAIDNIVVQDDVVSPATMLYDHFTHSPNGYDTSLWALESYGPGQVTWDEETTLGFTTYDHGYRTLVSGNTFAANVSAECRVKWANSDCLPAFGWTDVVPDAWNYHPADGENGVWVEFNWPEARKLALYSQCDGTASYQSITVDTYTEYHVYRLEWTGDAATLYVDETQRATLTNNIPDLDLPFKALVTAWAGDAQGQWLYLDLVNVTSLSPTTTPTTTTTATTSTTTASTTTATQTTTGQGILEYLFANPYVLGAVLVASATVIAACVRRRKGE